jgi:hypothetical protein
VRVLAGAFAFVVLLLARRRVVFFDVEAASFEAAFSSPVV